MMIFEQAAARFECMTLKNMWGFIMRYVNIRLRK